MHAMDVIMTLPGLLGLGEYPRAKWREMLVLTGLGRPLMWAASSALVLLLGARLTRLYGRVSGRR
jgi:hypothetical protein